MEFAIAGGVVLALLIGVCLWVDIKDRRWVPGSGHDAPIHSADVRAAKRAMRRKLFEKQPNPRPPLY